MLLAAPGVSGAELAIQQAQTVAENQAGASVATGVGQPADWMRELIALDPKEFLRHVSCPVLAMNGAKDKQVLPEPNLSGIRQALESGGNRHFEALEMPGLNHLFQTADTGWPREYGHIQETISPIVLDKISTWIRTQTR